MGPIHEFVERREFTFARRCLCTGGDLNFRSLALDVFGEPARFYRVSDICYIGRNHGILEPLVYQKPIVVGFAIDPQMAPLRMVDLCRHYFCPAQNTNIA